MLLCVSRRLPCRGAHNWLTGRQAGWVQHHAQEPRLHFGAWACLRFSARRYLAVHARMYSRASTSCSCAARAAIPAATTVPNPSPRRVLLPWPRGVTVATLAPAVGPVAIGPPPTSATGPCRRRRSPRRWGGARGVARGSRRRRIGTPSLGGRASLAAFLRPGASFARGRPRRGTVAAQHHKQEGPGL